MKDTYTLFEESPDYWQSSLRCWQQDKCNHLPSIELYAEEPENDR